MYAENETVSKMLKELSICCELKSDKYRAMAYGKAAKAIASLNQSIADIDPMSVFGVGKSIAGKIEEFLETGGCVALAEMKKDVEAPAYVVTALTALPGIGVRGAVSIWCKYRVESIEQLGEAIKAGTVTDSDLVTAYRQATTVKRVPLPVMMKAVESLLEKLRGVDGIVRLSIAGSMRRKKDLVRDVDIVVCVKGKDRAKVIAEIRTVLAEVGGGSVKLSGELVVMGIPRHVDISVTEPTSWGACLMYLTGSKEHNIKLRQRAKARGWTLNEYGLWEGENQLAGETEEGIYEQLGLEFIPPELREEWFIDELFLGVEVPRLVEQSDICGDLHVHTEWSDGILSLHDVVDTAHALKYSWIGVSDHSAGLRVAHGLDAARLVKQIREIRKIRRRSIRVFAGSEVDIKRDGTLDYGDEIFSMLDFVIGAVHFAPGKNLEARYMAAMNAGVRILAHPTGRRLGLGVSGKSIEIPDMNWDLIFIEAAHRGVYLEINASPDRLDLPDHLVRRAKKLGCKFVLGSDAHGNDFGSILAALAVARRAGLEKKDIFNCERNPPCLRQMHGK